MKGGKSGGNPTSYGKKMNHGERPHAEHGKGGKKGPSTAGKGKDKGAYY